MDAIAPIRPAQRKRLGWESPGARERRNVLGDLSVRIGLAGIGALWLGVVLGPIVLDERSLKVSTVEISAIVGGIIGLAGLFLALAGVHRARGTGEDARSAGWGFAIALLQAASVTLVCFMCAALRS